MILTITMNPAMDRVYAVDDFKVGQVFRAQDMTVSAGGKGINVARVASILGKEVIASGVIGGNIGNFIDKEVRKVNIDSEFLSIEGETRICINIMDEKNTTSTEVLESGPVVSEIEAEKFLKHYQNLLEKCEVVTVSGSLPDGLPVDFYRKLIKIAKQKNKIIILDTSGDYFKEGIKEIPYMVKPNGEEIEAIMEGKFTEIEDYCRALEEFQKKGIQLPVISLGKEGSIALLENEIYFFESLALEVKNTVGSGDSFIAGCAIGLSNDKDLVDVIKLGMACAHANTQFFETGMVSPELVDKYFEEIKVRKVKKI